MSFLRTSRTTQITVSDNMQYSIAVVIQRTLTYVFHLYKPFLTASVLKNITLSHARDTMIDDAIRFDAMELGGFLPRQRPRAYGSFRLTSASVTDDVFAYDVLTHSRGYCGSSISHGSRAMTQRLSRAYKQ